MRFIKRQTDQSAEAGLQRLSRAPQNPIQPFINCDLCSQLQLVASFLFPKTAFEKPKEVAP
jgi:hypothetical protein